MIEPFIPVRKPRDDIIDEETDKPIFNMSVSRLSSCYVNTVLDIDEEKKKPITQELSEIFDIGNREHTAEEILNRGAKRIIDQETYLKILHESKKFSVSGLRDEYEFDFYGGRYISDYKTAKHENHYPDRSWGNKINWSDGFIHFLIDGASEDNIVQLSGYSYLEYVHTGFHNNKGVIKKIDKNNPRNRIQLECVLLTKEEIRNKILRHPVIHFVLGKITEEQLQEICIAQMQKYVRADRGGNKKCWKCGNCVYGTPPNTCEVKEYIES